MASQPLPPYKLLHSFFFLSYSFFSLSSLSHKIILLFLISSINIDILTFWVLQVKKQGFPGSSDGKEFACNVEDLGSNPGLRSSGEGNGNPLQYPGLEKSMDRGAWWAAVHGVTNGQT